VAHYRDARDRTGQAHALNQLGWLRVLTGGYAAAASIQQALALARRASDRFVEADTLIHLGLVQQLTGRYPAADTAGWTAVMLSHAFPCALATASAPGQAGGIKEALAYGEGRSRTLSL
jgi:hypothetical protein